MRSYNKKKINFADAWWKVGPNTLAALVLLLLLFASAPNTSFGAETCAKSEHSYSTCQANAKKECAGKKTPKEENANVHRYALHVRKNPFTLKVKKFCLSLSTKLTAKIAVMKKFSRIN